MTNAPKPATKPKRKITAKAAATARTNGAKGGAPKKLTADDTTLNIIRGLGNIMATNGEIAAVLGVTVPTLRAFMAAHQAAADALDIGKGQGRVSLRRKQFKMAETSAAMAIFLGKNYLEQADKLDTTLSGPGGGAVKVEQVAADAESFTRAIAGLASRAAEGEGVSEADAGNTGAA